MPTPDSSTAGVFPDPALSASVYCRGHLDAVLRRVVAPLRDQIRVENPDDGAYLWTVRYRKCGEHLKVRVHAPGERRDATSGLLEELTNRLFADLEPSAAHGAEGEGATAVAPIDLQDEASTDYPDRSLLLTDYRRSHVSLGNPLLLEHDEYAASLTRCLGAACDLAITALAADEAGKGARQNALLKAAISGLGALGFGAEERTEYLVYHRDWLIRFAIADAEKQAEILALFEPRAASGSGQLARIVAAQWNGDAAPPSGASGVWGRALGRLRSYLLGLAEPGSYCTDPFARHPSHPSIFKALHGLANQLGLSLLDEAFGYHMLLRATAGTDVGASVEPWSEEPS